MQQRLVAVEQDTRTSADATGRELASVRQDQDALRKENKGLREHIRMLTNELDQLLFKRQQPAPASPRRAPRPASVSSGSTPPTKEDTSYIGDYYPISAATATAPTRSTRCFHRKRQSERDMIDASRSKYFFPCFSSLRCGLQWRAAASRTRRRQGSGPRRATEQQRAAAHVHARQGAANAAGRRHQLHQHTPPQVRKKKKKKKKR